MGCIFMIIIKKKSLVKITTAIFVCLVICLIQIASVTDKTVPTVTLPVTNKVIVIDAGHGVPDEGDNLLK